MSALARPLPLSERHESPSGPTGRDLAVATSDGTVDLDALWGALEQVEDPELPLSVVDLGLPRRLDVTAGRVRVGMTYTSLACPCVEILKEDVTAAVAAVGGVREVAVDDVLEPWSLRDVSPAGRDLLRAVGVI